MENAATSDQALKTWTAAREQMWAVGIRPLKGLQMGALGSDYRAVLEDAEQSVALATGAQSEWVAAVTEHLNRRAPASDDEVAAAAEVRAAMSRWTELHQRFWQLWFNALRQLNPYNPAETGISEADAQSIVSAWEDSAPATYPPVRG
jgi:hypothetical protein